MLIYYSLYFHFSIARLPASNILNFDETNLSDDPGSQKCLFRRGMKYPERVMNTSETLISVMFAISGSGSVLPPYTVCKAERLYDQLEGQRTRGIIGQSHRMV